MTAIIIVQQRSAIDLWLVGHYDQHNLNNYRRKSEASLSEEQCSVLTKHRVDSRSLKKPCSTFIEIKERLKSEKHLPQINLNELEYEEQLKFLQEATQVLSENQKIRETTIELSIRR